MARLHGVLNGARQVDILSVAGRQTKLQQGLDVARFAGVVECLRNVIGGEVEVQLDGMAVRCTNHAILNLITSFLVGVGDGFEMPSAQPMVVASLVSNGLREFTRVYPAVDVHVNVEFFWSVAENQGEDASEGVGFTVAHDEFPFVVANRAVGS